MSLKQQFSLLAMLLVIVLLGGSLVFTLNNTRQAFEQQLDARAYDAANALSLAMSQVAGEDDAQLLRLMDALYDRGFFERIELEKIDGSMLHKRNEALASESGVPIWYKRFWPLQTIISEADIMNGWQRFGTVRVTSNKEMAYSDLWTITKTELSWYALVLVIALALLQWLLHWLFKPLRAVELQARAICERKLQVQKDIPRSRELKQMVLAMNQMVLKLRTIFNEQVNVTEQLKAETYNDTLTGLLNRRGFDERFSSLLKNQQEHSGVLMLLQLRELASLNALQGRQAADELIQQLGQSLKQWTQNHAAAFVGRRSGSDFALYIPVIGYEQAEVLCQQLYEHLTTSVLEPKRQVPCHIGAVLLQEVTDSSSQALSRADAALRAAQLQQGGGIRLYQAESGRDELTAGQWQELLIDVLNNERLELLFQPVINPADASLVQLEVFSRIEHEGQALSAGRFWPMVEQHQLAPQFDALIIRKAIAQLKEVSLPKGVRCCINISAASIADEFFCKQLAEVLAQAPDQAAQMAFEVPESSLASIESVILKFSQIVQPYSVRLGVDQVGTGGMAFSYLQRLPFNYLRIDGSFSRGLAKAQDQRFFVRSMVQIANSLERFVVAEGIEEDEDKQALQQIGVHALSGYLFSRPVSDIQQALHWQQPN